MPTRARGLGKVVHADGGNAAASGARPARYGAQRGVCPIARCADGTQRTHRVCGKRRVLRPAVPEEAVSRAATVDVERERDG